MAVYSGLNMTSYSSMYKDMYIQAGAMDRMLYDDPLLMRVEKVRLTKKVEGENIVIPFTIGRHPAVSRDFNVAQNIAKSNTAARGNWTLPMDSAFGVGRIENKTIRASATDRGAFERALENEINSAIYSSKMIRCQDFHAPQPNQKGVVGSVSGSTVTLKNKWQAVNFDVNDQVKFYAAVSGTVPDTGGTARGGGTSGVYKVTKVDLPNAVITFSTAVDSAVAADDGIYRDGDYGETAMASLHQWLPKVTTGLSTTFFGQDRSVNIHRLAGFRKTAAAASDIAANIRNLAAQISAGSKTNGPDIAVMHPLVKDYIVAQSDSKIRFASSSGSGGNSLVHPVNGDIAFRKTNGGLIEPIVTPFADPTVIFLLNTRYMALYYYGSPQNGRFVDFDYGDNNMIWRTSHDAAGVEIRTESYGNLCLHYPGTHGRLDLDNHTIPLFG